MLKYTRVPIVLELTDTSSNQRWPYQKLDSLVSKNVLTLVSDFSHVIMPSLGIFDKRHILYIY